MVSEKINTFLRYFPQVFASVTASFGAMSDGMQYSWQSPSVPKLQQPDSPIPMTETDLIVLDSLYFIGSLAGLPIISYLTDKLGRKRTIQLIGVMFCAAWLLIAFANNVIILFVARFLAGFGSDTCYASAPLYIAEVADKKIRGFLGCFVYINFMVGVVVIYCVGPFTTIQNTAFVGLAVPLTQLLTFSFMPETPYCCLVKKDETNARKSLQFLRRTEDVQEELEEIQAAVERQEAEHGTFKDLLVVASNRKGLIIMMVLYFSQNFSATTVLFMNLHTILESAEGIFDVDTAAIIFAVVMLIAGVVGSILLENLGRVKLMNYSLAATGVSLGLICVYFWLKSYNVDLHHVRWLPAAAVILYAASFMVGIGLVPVLLSAELFPTTVKCSGIIVSVGCYTAFAFISMYFHRFVSEAYGVHIAFLVYTICCFGTIIFNIYYVPETTGKTLEEIQMILKGIKPAKTGRDSIKQGIVNEGYAKA